MFLQKILLLVKHNHLECKVALLMKVVFNQHEYWQLRHMECITQMTKKLVKNGKEFGNKKQKIQ